MKYTKEEVLWLDKLTEEEQIVWLTNKDILKERKNVETVDQCRQVDIYESLADCTFRLFAGLSPKQKAIFQQYINVFCYPIQWIQKALEIKIESEE